jgi:hypothetical protein
MSGRQRATRGAFALALLAGGAVAFAGCFLDTAGAAGDDVAPDHRDDADVVDPDTDVEPGDDGADGPADLPEGTCLVDRDCGDTTCADGSFWCNAGACTPLPPMICPDDGVRCTRNYCSVTSPTASSCVRQASNAWCPAGWSCDPSAGCVRRDRSCSTDAECDDGVACTEDSCVPGLAICRNDPPDADGDGVGAQECLGIGRVGDCDDTNPDVNPNHPEVCKNLLDDDCDGLTDYADDDCAGNLDNDLCENAVPLLVGPGSPSSLDGSLAGYGQEFFSGCGGEGPDAFFQVTLAAEGRVVFDTSHSALDTVIAVLDGCGGAELLCNDDRNDDPTSGSRVEHRRLGPGTYIIAVNGKTASAAGPYTFHYLVEGPPPAADCSNPVDATDGGTFVGYLSDPSYMFGLCASARTTIGYQEQFVVHMPAPADLAANSAGTAFEAALYLRASSCGSLDERVCQTGAAVTGTSIHPVDGWSGDAFITLDYMPGTLDFEGDPGSPYRIEINP